MPLWQIVGGTVFDARRAEVIPNGVVCIDRDRITAVGPASTMATGGRDVRVLDAAGQFVMPGMIDCHVHLLSSPPARDYASRGLKELLPYAAIRGAVHAATMLERGFTTVRDVGAAGYGNIALRQAIADGLVPGPRLYAAGHSLSVPGRPWGQLLSSGSAHPAGRAHQRPGGGQAGGARVDQDGRGCRQAARHWWSDDGRLGRREVFNGRQTNYRRRLPRRINWGGALPGIVMAPLA